MFWVTTGSTLPAFSSADDRAMSGVRLRVPKPLPALQLVIPMFDPRRFRSHEILEVNRLPPFPDALGSAKIGDSTAGRNSGAGENHHAAATAADNPTERSRPQGNLSFSIPAAASAAFKASTSGGNRMPAFDRGLARRAARPARPFPPGRRSGVGFLEIAEKQFDLRQDIELQPSSRPRGRRIAERFQLLVQRFNLLLNRLFSDRSFAFVISADETHRNSSRSAISCARFVERFRELELFRQIRGRNFDPRIHFHRERLRECFPARGQNHGISPGHHPRAGRLRRGFWKTAVIGYSRLHSFSGSPCMSQKKRCSPGRAESTPAASPNSAGFSVSVPASEADRVLA